MTKISSKKIFGIALDIGTTYIKGILLDISSKKELARAIIPNEQKAFGQDVITRLGLAIKKDGLKKLNEKVISAISKLIKKLTEDAFICKCDIKKIIAVGNSTMYHLTLMIDPTSLAKAPFLPKEKKTQGRNACALGIPVGENTVFQFLPNISGFVGSDILASILRSKMHRSKKYNLMMDMGTNGEIAIGSQNKIFVTSCASGPAFEARHISSGQGQVKGAITHAKFTNKKFSFKTIGNTTPKSIGASGLIDIMSILLKMGIVDMTGRMKEKEFIIYKGQGRKISLTQKDIREIQLAKAAFSSGIEILRRKININLKNLEHFYITGAFGEGIDKKNARNIGLIPKEIPLNKITFLKDGALTGARDLLIKTSSLKEIESILAKCEHVELHKCKDFEDTFANSMHF